MLRPKWFLPETQERLVPEAGRILKSYADGSIGLLVPDLFWAEIGGMCWKAVRIGRMWRSSAEEALVLATNRTLITADERLANALAAYFPVRWLGSL